MNFNSCCVNGCIELCLVTDVLNSMSTKSYWKSQTVHLVVNQATVGAIRGVNLAARVVGLRLNVRSNDYVTIKKGQE